MRLRLLILPLVWLTGLLFVPSAFAAYGRNGPYLDYSTTFALGAHGVVPRSEYSFGTYYTPVTVSQYGLQAAANLTVTGDRAYRADALLAARWLVHHQSSGGGWRYRFRFTVQGFPALHPGWVSAMAQGQAMSLLWRAYRLHPAPAFRAAAVRAVGVFSRSIGSGGVVGDFDGVPWYEEYPTRPGSHVLNGYLFSLLGLYDIAPWSSRASRLFHRGVSSLRARMGVSTSRPAARICPGCRLPATTTRFTSTYWARSTTCVPHRGSSAIGAVGGRRPFVRRRRSLAHLEVRVGLGDAAVAIIVDSPAHARPRAASWASSRSPAGCATGRAGS